VSLPAYLCPFHGLSSSHSSLPWNTWNGTSPGDPNAEPPSGREFFNAIEKQLNHSKLKVQLLNGKTT